MRVTTDSDYFDQVSRFALVWMKMREKMFADGILSRERLARKAFAEDADLG